MRQTSPSACPPPGTEALTPTFSSQGNRFAYQRLIQRFDIWQVDAGGAQRPPEPAASPVSSTSLDAHPEYSPDGRRVVFQSERSGSREIWVSNRNGTEAVQLTDFSGPEAGSPDWSPDGSQVVFDSIAEGQWNIYVVNADGGQPRRITKQTGSSPEWSRDGKWIYFSSGRDRRFTDLEDACQRRRRRPVNAPRRHTARRIARRAVCLLLQEPQALAVIVANAV